MSEYSVRELAAMLKLKCDYLGQDVNTLQDDIDKGYMTISRGWDGCTYAWYLDESNNVICDVETLEIFDNADIIDILAGD